MLAATDHPRLEGGQVHVWIGASPEQVLPEYVARPAIVTGRNGKPRLSDRSSGITFSKSGTDGLTVVALTRDRAIGADVERIDTTRNWEAIAARLFTDRERARLERCEPARRAHCFHAIWTAKEARVKATGEGLPQLVAGDEPDLDLIELELPAGYVGAVAIGRDGSDHDPPTVIYSRLDG